MTLVYNIEPVIEDWVFTKSDTINESRNALKNNVPYIMTGMQIDIYVRRRDDLLVRQFTTSGGSPEITILLDVFTIYATGFTEVGAFKYDIQVTDLAGDILTIGKGNLFVLKDITR